MGMNPSCCYTKARVVGGVVGQGGSLRVLEPKAGSSGDAGGRLYKLGPAVLISRSPCGREKGFPSSGLEIKGDGGVI